MNKKKVRKVEKYLVYWKEFMAEHDTWEKEEDLKNAREVLEEFEEKMNVEMRWQKKNISEEENYQGNLWQGYYMNGMMESLRGST